MSLNLLESKIKRQAEIQKRNQLLEKGILTRSLDSATGEEKVDDLPPSPMNKGQFSSVESRMSSLPQVTQRYSGAAVKTQLHSKMGKSSMISP